MRHCDRLCTLIGVQSHAVKNSSFLKISLIQHTFTQLLPLPFPDGSEEAKTKACVWRSPLLYAQQLDLMLLLQRIIEHFAASVFTVDHTRSADAVRMVVPACIAAVADVVMRQVAVDIPSEVCIHLRGVDNSESAPAKKRGFALGAGALARQSATVSVHTPELNMARTMALDYFNAQAR